MTEEHDSGTTRQNESDPADVTPASANVTPKTGDTNSANRPTEGNPSEDGLIDADLAALDAQTEALIRGALASLPPLTMPDDVHARIMAALQAEPNPYANTTAANTTAANTTAQATTADTTQAPATTPATVTELPRRTRGSGWFVGVAGIAAASVLALFVGTSVLDSNSGHSPAISASAVPMTASSSQYQKATFSAQVAEALPRWRTMAAQQVSANTAPDTTATPTSDRSTASTPDLTAQDPAAQNPATQTPAPADAAANSPQTTTAPTPGAPEISPSTNVAVIPVDSGLREQIASCLSQVSDQTPMHVEIASYQSGPNMPPEPVAVAAVDGANSSIEVFAIKVSCVERDPLLVREHVTINTQ